MTRPHSTIHDWGIPIDSSHSACTTQTGYNELVFSTGVSRCSYWSRHPVVRTNDPPLGTSRLRPGSDICCHHQLEHLGSQPQVSAGLVNEALLPPTPNKYANQVYWLCFGFTCKKLVPDSHLKYWTQRQPCTSTFSWRRSVIVAYGFFLVHTGVLWSHPITMGNL